MSYILQTKNISQKKIGQLFIQDTAGTLAISSIMQDYFKLATQCGCKKANIHFIHFEFIEKR